MWSQHEAQEGMHSYEATLFFPFIAFHIYHHRVFVIQIFTVFMTFRGFKQCAMK